MSYRNAPRFQAIGYFGTPDYTPLCINVLAERAFEAARRAGTVQGIEKYGDGDTAHLMLAHDLFYIDEWNDKANWVQSAGGSHYFVAVPAVAFRSTGAAHGISTAATGGMAFINGAFNVTSLFTTSETILAVNAPWTLRVLLMKPDPAQFYSRFIADWAGWRFQIEKGDASVVRLAPPSSTGPGYSEALDYERMSLLNQKNIPASDQARANEIEGQIYVDKTSVNRVGNDDWYAAAHDISFVPTSHGVMNVIIEGEGAQNATEARDSSLCGLRVPTTMWPATRVSVGSNGGAFAWQLGRPLYATTGSFNMVPYPTLLGHDDGGSITISGNREPNGANNSITAVVADLNEAFQQIQFTFNSDGVTSPILYSAQAFEQGDTRDGSADVALDTNDLATSGIVDIVPQFDEHDKRTSVQVTMRFVNGDVAGAGFPGDATQSLRPFLHDRLASVWVNGTLLLGNGLITSSSVTDVKQIDMAADPVTFAVGDTRVVLQIADMWEMANRLRLKKQPVGDGMALGAYIRIILGMMGFKDSEIEGVSEGAGRNLPQAVFGEKPCVQPALDARGGDFLRTLMDTWGMGLQLSCNTGVWTLGSPSTSSVAMFKSSSTLATWPARFTSPPTHRVMNDGPDMSMDFGDFYNVFTVIGGKDPNGIPITATWRDEESMTLPVDPAHIGYEKPYETVTNEGLRTLDDVQFACRALAQRYGKAGRFFNFKTWWIDGLHPGDVVTIDGLTWTIARITSASVKQDRMSFSARQNVPSAGGF